MYATTTDWSFEEWTQEHQKLLEEKYLPMFKSVGALNFYYIKTSDTTGRTVTIWPNKDTADKVLEKMRASAGDDTGGKVTATSQGEVMGSI
jgi:hypothetical protein